MLFDVDHDGMLPDDRLNEIESFFAAASSLDHEFRAYDDALDFIAGRRDAEIRVSSALGARSQVGFDERKGATSRRQAANSAT